MNDKTLKLILILCCICTIIGCDQASKYYIKNTLEQYTTYQIVGTLFVFTYTENTGGFLGLGSGLPPDIKPAVLMIIPGIVLIAMFMYLVLHSIHKDEFPKIEVFGFCCIIGGGIGNLIDRTLHGGRVIDFMNFGIGGLRTGILNIADLAVTLGITIIIINQIRSLFDGKRGSNQPVA
jgi:signal peptidase II